MITRAYPNSKGERQEITLSQAEWENTTQEDIDRMLGFGAEPEPTPAPVVKQTPAAKKAAAKKGK